MPKLDLKRVQNATLNKIKDTGFQFGHDVLNILQDALVLVDEPVPAGVTRSTDSAPLLPAALPARSPQPRTASQPYRQASPGDGSVVSETQPEEAKNHSDAVTAP